MGATVTSEAMDICRGQVRALTAAIKPRLAALVAEDPIWAEGLTAFADEHGLDVGPDALSTAASQAALLAVLRLAQAEMSGTDTDPALARSLAEAVQLASTAIHDSYEESLLDRLLDEMDEPAAIAPDDLVAALRRAGLDDAIGDIYTETVPQPERRKMGQFWTPDAISDLMAAWSIRSASDTVLEPASGSGRMVVSAIRRLRDLGCDDACLSGNIYANEISELVRTLMLTTLRAGTDQAFPHADLADFMTARTPEQMRYDAVICNPPYTRHHLLPASYKADLKAVVERETGIKISGFASLFTHFYLHGLAVLTPGGRASNITPAELFDASYAAPIKDYVLKHANLRALIHFADELLAFEGVDTAGVISLTEQGESDGVPIAFVAVRQWPGTETMLAALEAGAAEYDWGSVTLRSRESLAIQRKWFHGAAQDARVGTVTLGSVARTMRGIATGANDFFALTDDERTRLGIDEKYLTPVLLKTRDAAGLVLTKADIAALRLLGRKSWLFGYYDRERDLTGTAEGDYIAQAESRKVHEGSLVSKRSLWYECERRPVPPLIYTYLARGNPRFILNEAGANTLNTFLHVTPKPAITSDPVTLTAFAAILNSPFVIDQLKTVGRSYGGGTIKVEPRELDRLMVLDPSTLPRQTQVTLAGHFRAAARGDDAASAMAAISSIIETALTNAGGIAAA